MQQMNCVQITKPCEFSPDRKLIQPGKVEIIRRDVPVLTAGNAIIKTLYGGVCGSDIGTYLGAFLYAKYPQIPGHEFSGEIVEIDENNPYGLKRGMIVTVNPYFNCGTFSTCRS